jgi:hypothetical protein
VHGSGLGLGQAQTQRCEHLGDVLAQGFHVGSLAVHEHDVRSARGALPVFPPVGFPGLPPAPDVRVSAHPALPQAPCADRLFLTPLAMATGWLHLGSGSAWCAPRRG